jgi:hypothetical protein
MNLYETNNQLSRTIFMTGVVAISAVLLVGIQTALATPPTPTPTPCECTNPITETMVSDANTTVIGDSATAVAVHPAWTASIPGATWIWESGATTPDEIVAFEQNFTAVGTVISAQLDIATDNSYKVFIDNVEVASDPADNNFQLATQDVHNLTASVTPGAHTLRIEVKNVGAYNVNSNPAGLLFKFEIKTCPLECCGGDVTINVNNSAYVKNDVDTTAQTGGNTANGGSGGSGGNGGDIKNSGDDIKNSSTGNGGNGGNGWDATVITGKAKAKSKVVNIVNINIIRRR